MHTLHSIWDGTNYSIGLNAFVVQRFWRMNKETKKVPWKCTSCQYTGQVSILLPKLWPKCTPINSLTKIANHMLYSAMIDSAGSYNMVYIQKDKLALFSSRELAYFWNMFRSYWMKWVLCHHRIAPSTLQYKVTGECKIWCGSPQRPISF